MNSNELQLEFIGGNRMDKVAMVKKEVQMQNWSEAELARQESGLTVTQCAPALKLRKIPVIKAEKQDKTDQ